MYNNSHVTLKEFKFGFKVFERDSQGYLKLYTVSKEYILYTIFNYDHGYLKLDTASYESFMDIKKLKHTEQIRITNSENML